LIDWPESCYICEATRAKMNIYKVSQSWNNDYDTFSDIVCIAESEQAARETHPYDSVTHCRDGQWYGTDKDGTEMEMDFVSVAWVMAEDIWRLEVTMIGVACDDQPKGVVCASFHAG